MIRDHYGIFHMLDVFPVKPIETMDTVRYVPRAEALYVPRTAQTIRQGFPTDPHKKGGLKAIVLGDLSSLLG
jgi:hypothetical protein